MQAVSLDSDSQAEQSSQPEAQLRGLKLETRKRNSKLFSGHCRGLSADLQSVRPKIGVPGRT